ncbi:uncharacterized protein LOC34624501 [Cyclospora cayetanensis]|uniref:Uncharacterized protein LOC34624501 n=1 Tax=Cyclospora cayetanensis TaxID=88456 RepID=A0A6P6RQN9_9EIME|nr:uncharacterized protein LOC34624501 [Cyclospora cayetanensis]
MADHAVYLGVQRLVKAEEGESAAENTNEEEERSDRAKQPCTRCAAKSEGDAGRAFFPNSPFLGSVAAEVLNQFVIDSASLRTDAATSDSAANRRASSCCSQTQGTASASSADEALPPACPSPTLRERGAEALPIGSGAKPSLEAPGKDTALALAALNSSTPLGGLPPTAAAAAAPHDAAAASCKGGAGEKGPLEATQAVLAELMEGLRLGCSSSTQEGAIQGPSSSAAASVAAHLVKIRKAQTMAELSSYIAVFQGALPAVCGGGPLTASKCEALLRALDLVCASPPSALVASSGNGNGVCPPPPQGPLGAPAAEAGTMRYPPDGLEAQQLMCFRLLEALSVLHSSFGQRGRAASPQSASPVYAYHQGVILAAKASRQLFVYLHVVLGKLLLHAVHAVPSLLLAAATEGALVVPAERPLTLLRGAPPQAIEEAFAALQTLYEAANPGAPSARTSQRTAAADAARTEGPAAAAAAAAAAAGGLRSRRLGDVARSQGGADAAAASATATPVPSLLCSPTIRFLGSSEQEGGLEGYAVRGFPGGTGLEPVCGPPLPPAAKGGAPPGGAPPLSLQSGAAAAKGPAAFSLSGLLESPLGALKEEPGGPLASPAASSLWGPLGSLASSPEASNFAEPLEPACCSSSGPPGGPPSPSGGPNVSFDATHNRWIAFWRSQGRSHSKSFSCAKYGGREAARLQALGFRRQLQETAAGEGCAGASAAATDIQSVLAGLNMCQSQKDALAALQQPLLLRQSGGGGGPQSFLGALGGSAMCPGVDPRDAAHSGLSGEEALKALSLLQELRSGSTGPTTAGGGAPPRKPKAKRVGGGGVTRVDGGGVPVRQWAVMGRGPTGRTRTSSARAKSAPNTPGGPRRLDGVGVAAAEELRCLGRNTSSSGASSGYGTEAPALPSPLQGAESQWQMRLRVVSGSITFDRSQNRFMAQWKTSDGCKHSKSFYIKNFSSVEEAQLNALRFKENLLAERDSERSAAAAGIAAAAAQSSARGGGKHRSNDGGPHGGGGAPAMHEALECILSRSIQSCLEEEAADGSTLDKSMVGGSSSLVDSIKAAVAAAAASATETDENCAGPSQALSASMWEEAGGGSSTKESGGPSQHAGGGSCNGSKISPQGISAKRCRQQAVAAATAAAAAAAPSSFAPSPEPHYKRLKHLLSAAVAPSSPSCNMPTLLARGREGEAPKVAPASVVGLQQQASLQDAAAAGAGGIGGCEASLRGPFLLLDSESVYGSLSNKLKSNSTYPPSQVATQYQLAWTLQLYTPYRGDPT